MSPAEDHPTDGIRVVQLEDQLRLVREQLQAALHNQGTHESYTPPASPASSGSASPDPGSPAPEYDDCDVDPYVPFDDDGGRDDPDTADPAPMVQCLIEFVSAQTTTIGQLPHAGRRRPTNHDTSLRPHISALRSWATIDRSNSASVKRIYESITRLAMSGLAAMYRVRDSVHSDPSHDAIKATNNSVLQAWNVIECAKDLARKAHIQFGETAQADRRRMNRALAVMGRDTLHQCLRRGPVVDDEDDSGSDA